MQAIRRHRWALRLIQILRRMRTGDSPAHAAVAEAIPTTVGDALAFVGLGALYALGFALLLAGARA